MTVQKLNCIYKQIVKTDIEILNILRMIYHKDHKSQRQLAKELSFSLGKINYCLKSLKSKGLIKIKTLKRINKK